MVLTGVFYPETSQDGRSYYFFDVNNDKTQVGGFPYDKQDNLLHSALKTAFNQGSSITNEISTRSKFVSNYRLTLPTYDELFSFFSDPTVDFFDPSATNLARKRFWTSQPEKLTTLPNNGLNVNVGDTFGSKQSLLLLRYLVQFKYQIFSKTSVQYQQLKRGKFRIYD